MDEELNVKVGDKVLYNYRNSERIETVKKVTPTGRIRIEGSDSMFSKYGVEMGDSWYKAHLSIPTDEDYKRIRENKAISEALSLISELNTQTLSYDVALKIIEILSE